VQTSSLVNHSPARSPDRPVYPSQRRLPFTQLVVHHCLPCQLRFPAFPKSKGDKKALVTKKKTAPNSEKRKLFSDYKSIAHQVIW
jgi:hypothetical protein